MGEVARNVPTRTKHFVGTNANNEAYNLMVREHGEIRVFVEVFNIMDNSDNHTKYTRTARFIWETRNSDELMELWTDDFKVIEDYLNSDGLPEACTVDAIPGNPENPYDVHEFDIADEMAQIDMISDDSCSIISYAHMRAATELMVNFFAK